MRTALLEGHVCTARRRLCGEIERGVVWRDSSQHGLPVAAATVSDGRLFQGVSRWSQARTPPGACCGERCLLCGCLKRCKMVSARASHVAADTEALVASCLPCPCTNVREMSRQDPSLYSQGTVRQKVLCVCRNADFAPAEPVIKDSCAHRPCHHERDDTAASVICLNTEKQSAQAQSNYRTAVCAHLSQYSDVSVYMHM